MANGQVEIHDMLSAPSVDSELASDTDSMEDSVEYRLMLAYATRRRPPLRQGVPTHNDDHSHVDGLPHRNEGEEETTTTTTVVTKKKKKKKKKGFQCLPSIFKCASPQAEEVERPQGSPNQENNPTFRTFVPEAPEEEVKGQDKLEEVVSRLTEIVEDVPLTESEIEPDAPEEKDNHSKEVEVLVGLLLRDLGDNINEKELKDANITADLFLNYDFFKTLINAALRRMGLRSSEPEAPGPQASPKTQLAVTCEFTSRLLTISTLPTSRLMNHGARYLQEYFSCWARQQGGYVTAFEEDEVQ